MQDEQNLVERAQKYDQEAFAQLYEQHFDKIYRYIALKIGNRADAEDMTQQVFLKSLKSISSYRWRDIPFSAWLFRIAHNQVVDYLRKKTRQHTTSLNNVLAISDSSPQQSAEDRIVAEQLVSASRKLTPAQQEVISLRFASELPIAQVAKIMGKSPGAIKALQHSAIESLRKIMVNDKDV
ncbi:MAG TPA: sigma-70 family RNA polymerase sigma factor [Dehalococcoidia bacterium]|nr:sigma-70 family RNA polymerase sigma factor [Dehalococcoidia bacterium]